MIRFLNILLLLISVTMTSQQNSTTPLIHVSGVGTLNITPDRVSFSVRVESIGPNAVVVKNQNDKIVSNVIEFLKAQKLSSSNFKTQYLHLNKNFDYKTKTYNYSANQSLLINLMELENYEKIMSGLLELGINRIDGLNFKSSKQVELEQKARVLAMKDAKNKAETYARAVGQSVGKAVTISEHKNVSTPQYSNRMLMDADPRSGGQTIAPGQLAIQSEIQVSFILN